MLVEALHCWNVNLFRIILRINTHVSSVWRVQSSLTLFKGRCSVGHVSITSSRQSSGMRWWANASCAAPHTSTARLFLNVCGLRMSDNTLRSRWNVMFPSLKLCLAAGTICPDNDGALIFWLIWQIYSNYTHSIWLGKQKNNICGSRWCSVAANVINKKKKKGHCFLIGCACMGTALGSSLLLYASQQWTVSHADTEWVMLLAQTDTGFIPAF